MLPSPTTYVHAFPSFSQPYYLLVSHNSWYFVLSSYLLVDLNLVLLSTQFFPTVFLLLYYNLLSYASQTFFPSNWFPDFFFIFSNRYLFSLLPCSTIVNFSFSSLPKGTVSSDIGFYFRVFKIKSVLSLGQIMVFISFIA